MSCSCRIHKVAGVKVYLRQTWNVRSHAVSACIGLWHHRLMHALHWLMHACMHYMHCPMTSQAHACSYYMGSVALISSRIYLYLQLLCRVQQFPRNFLHWQAPGCIYLFFQIYDSNWWLDFFYPLIWVHWLTPTLTFLTAATFARMDDEREAKNNRQLYWKMTLGPKPIKRFYGCKLRIFKLFVPG